MQIVTTRVGETMPILDKIDFKPNTVKNKEIMIKGSIHQGNITVTNIYAPNIRAPKYVQQKGRNSSAIIVGHFSTPL